MKRCICLLIDDDPDDREIFTTALNEVVPEAVCYIATDGNDALHRLINRRFVPDVIFLDINMPKMNGYEFLKAIKEIKDLKHIPVVVHSTTTNQQEIEFLKKLGAFDVHIKDNNYKSVCNMLSKFIINVCNLRSTAIK